ncbi:hypothetical protein C9374_010907 [Naegleria lovaniensis]|uniref:RGS domain-containing protein n=1 Tax=Naegleria lovaniensis TaxID=51637 RepID=A0AA88GEW9_NAELO|nr:uncharacterized protein C9374_010907 [Naegleria lovaniensis]KAG2374337.1 hypothetical protein C9374_010907 [Naegleria lovaniensis]
MKPFLLKIMHEPISRTNPSPSHTLKFILLLTTISLLVLLSFLPNHFSLSKLVKYSSNTNKKLNVTIEELSIREYYEAIQDYDWNILDDNKTHYYIHIIHIRSHQITVTPKPFLTFNTTGVPDSNVENYYQSLLSVLSTVNNPYELLVFLSKYAKNFVEPQACCSVDDDAMMVGWTAAELFYVDSNLTVSLGNGDWEWMTSTTTSTTSTTSTSSSSSSSTNHRLAMNELLQRQRQLVNDFKRPRSSTSNGVSVKQQKTSLSGANFNVKMGETHWLLDQYWASRSAVTMEIDLLDHLLLNLKNNLYLQTSHVNNSLTLDQIQNVTFGDIFKAVPTDGVKSVLVLRTSTPIDITTNITNLFTSEQINEISEVIREDITNNIIDILERFDMNYPDCKIYNSTARQDMRDYHNALLRFIMGFGWTNSKQIISIMVYLAHINAVVYGKAYEMPSISYTNYFYWNAMKDLYEKGDLDHVINTPELNMSFNTSSPFSSVNMVALYTLLRRYSQDFISELFTPTSCFSSYNSYLTMYHYNYVDAYGYFVYKDVMLYLIIFVGIFFYLGLFLTYFIHRKTGNITVRRRFLLPFIGPLCFMALPIYFIEPVWNSQYIDLFRSKTSFSVTGIYPNFFISLFFATYSVTVLRFYYLKNLYWIMNKLGTQSTSSKNMKFHKIMVSKPVSVVSTIVVTIFVFGCWLAYYFNVYGESSVQTISAYNTQLELLLLVPFASLVILLALICIVCLVVDLVANRKKVQQQGFIKFFLDDPFYLRIDLALMFVVAGLACFIYLGLGEKTTQASKALLFVLLVICYLVVGGNVIIYELTMSLLYFIRYGSSKYTRLQSESNQKPLFEILISDPTFRQMFRDYSVNEYAVENLQLYEELEKLEKNSQYVTLEDLQHIDEQFMKRFSPFEVNIPATARKQFNELLNRAQNDSDALQILFSDLKSTLHGQIMLNIMDTFSRMELTTEFKKWKETKDLQKEIELGQ